MHGLPLAAHVDEVAAVHKHMQVGAAADLACRASRALDSLSGLDYVGP
jgi:hypothetical protein